MCGIAGILRFDRYPVKRQWLERMNQTMVDRGPDDSGIYLDQNFGMGIRRLSIIDIETGHQPIMNEDGSIFVIMNGEIYNYLELRLKLEQKGHVFKTRSDTEVLVHMYEEYGTDCLTYLVGMFAFAIWDKKQRTLWIARDRFGVKPLVFYHDENLFGFASTQTALTQLPGFQKSVDIDSLLLYLNLSYVPAPKAIWKGICKLLPGQSIVVNESSQLEISQYWDVSSTYSADVVDDEYEEKIKRLLQQSIEFNGRSDVPVGIFLSGGLDSTVVTALHCQRTDRGVHTFTVDCEGKSVEEGVFAKLVSEKYQTTHHHYTLTSGQSIVELDELLGKIDEPMGDSASISSYYLAKRASENDIKVVLCGAGGDELFGGYGRHYRGRRDILSGRLSLIPARWIQCLSQLNNQILHYGSIGWDSGTSFGLSISGTNVGILNSLLNNRELLLRGLNLVKDQFSSLGELEQKRGFQFGRLLTDISNYLPDNVLALMDKTTMAASVEGRVPLLDHSLAELVFSRSPETLLSNRFSNAKRTLKSAMVDEIPREIIGRDKVGFNGPVSHWMNSETHIFSKRLLELHSPELRSIVSAKQLRMLMQQKSHNAGSAETLFKLYVADCWFEKHA